MKPNAAVGWLLSGLVLMLLSQRSLMTLIRISARAVAIVVTLLGVLTLGEHCLHWNLRIDNLLFTNPPTSIADLHPGRMHPVTAFGFAMIGLALLAESLSTSRRIRVPFVGGLSATAALIGFLPLVG